MPDLDVHPCRQTKYVEIAASIRLDFFWTIFPELLDLLLPNLIQWCIIMSQRIMQKKIGLLSSR